MNSKTIVLDAINLDDERFRISYFFDLHTLIHSISEIGLIHPPVITYRDGNPTIITGWKRVLACRSLNLTPIPCFVFEGQDDLEAFRICLEENLASRDFSLLEKAQIVSRLIGLGVPEEAIVKNYLSLLQVPQTLHHLDAYLKIAALDPKTKEVIHSKKMVFPVAQLLTNYSHEERQTLLPFLIPLGQNKQREVLQNLFELSKRDGISVQKILAGEGTRKITEDQNLTLQQKSEEMRNHIQRKRYPTLSAWNDLFKSQKKSLGWPDDIQVEPSPFFEGQEFTVRFAFKDMDEYREKLAELNKVASDGKISQLLKSSPRIKASSPENDD